MKILTKNQNLLKNNNNNNNRSEEKNYWNKKYARGINRQLGDRELHINDLEDTIMEITQSEDQKKNNLTKDSFRDLWGNIKHINIIL